ncbi:MAG: pyridoxine 5'-phosphate synthase [Candidatus Kapaibacteriales bacterium]
MITLNVNIDHIATLRQARKGKDPDPIAAAVLCELAGANGIVCHLREDRRHINDRDVELLRQIVQTKLDLEMAAVEEIIQIALKIKPDLVTIVPERRLELTTESGLDVASNINKYKALVDRMHSKEIMVSFFVEPERSQIEASLEAGADMVEIHTGVYANSTNEVNQNKELNRINESANFAKNLGLKVAAGHGLNYQNVARICLIPSILELSIGHSIISRASLVGLQNAVREMIELIRIAESLRNI